MDNQYNSHHSSALVGGGKTIDQLNNIIRWMNALSGLNSTDFDNLDKYVNILKSIFEPAQDGSLKSASEVASLLNNLKTRLERKISENIGANGKTSLSLARNDFDQHKIYLPIDFSQVTKMYSDFVQKDKMFRLMVDENIENIRAIPSLSDTISTKITELKKKSNDFKHTISVLHNRLTELRQNDNPLYLVKNISWENSAIDISSNGTGFISGSEMHVKLDSIERTLTRLEDEIHKIENLRKDIKPKQDELAVLRKDLKDVLAVDDLLKLKPSLAQIRDILTNIQALSGGKTGDDWNQWLRNKVQEIKDLRVEIFDTEAKAAKFFEKADLHLAKGDYDMTLIGVFISNRARLSNKPDILQTFLSYSSPVIINTIDENISTLDTTNYREVITKIQEDVTKEIENLTQLQNWTRYKKFMKDLQTPGKSAAIVNKNNMPKLPKMVLSYIYGKLVEKILNEVLAESTVLDAIATNASTLTYNKQQIRIIQDQNPLLGTLYATDYADISGSLKNLKLTNERIKYWLGLYQQLGVVSLELANIKDETVSQKLLGTRTQLLNEKNELMGQIKETISTPNVLKNIEASLKILKGKLMEIEAEIRTTYKEMITDASDLSIILENTEKLGDVTHYYSHKQTKIPPNPLAGGFDVNTKNEFISTVGTLSNNKFTVLEKLREFSLQTDLLKKNLFQMYSLATAYIKLNRKLCIYYIYQFIVLRQSLKTTQKDIVPNKFISGADVTEMLILCKDMKDQIKNKVNTNSVKFFSNFHKYTINRSIALLQFISPLFTTSNFYINLSETHGVIADDLKTANHISVMIKTAP